MRKKKRRRRIHPLEKLLIYMMTLNISLCLFGSIGKENSTSETTQPQEDSSTQIESKYDLNELYHLGLEPVMFPYVAAAEPSIGISFPVENQTEVSVETEVQTETTLETETQPEPKTVPETQSETEIQTKSEIEQITEAQTEVENSTESETTEVELPVSSALLEFSQYRYEEYLLAQIIFCEVGNCSKDEMSWAGSVVLNRARTGYRDYKDVSTIEEVLYQGYGTKNQQYANATIEKIENGIVPSAESLEVAHGLLDGEIPCLDESVLGQTGFVPSWKVKIMDLPGATEVYWAPYDFEEYRNSLKEE